MLKSVFWSRSHRGLAAKALLFFLCASLTGQLSPATGIATPKTRRAEAQAKLFDQTPSPTTTPQATIKAAPKKTFAIEKKENVDHFGNALIKTMQLCRWAGYLLHPEQLLIDKLVCPAAAGVINMFGKKESDQQAQLLLELHDSVQTAHKSGKLSGQELQQALVEFAMIEKEHCKDFLDQTQIPVSQDAGLSLQQIFKGLEGEGVDNFFKTMQPELTNYIAKKLTEKLRQSAYYLTGDKSLNPEPSWITQKKKYRQITKMVLSNPLFTHLLFPIAFQTAVSKFVPEEQQATSFVAKMASSMAINPEESLSSAAVRTFCFHGAEKRPELYNAYRKANTIKNLAGATSSTMLTLHRPNPGLYGTDKTMAMIDCFDSYRSELDDFYSEDDRGDRIRQPYSFFKSLLFMTGFKTVNGILLSKLFKTPGEMMPSVLSRIVTNSASQEITTGLGHALRSEKVERWQEKSLFARFLSRIIPGLWYDQIKDKFEELGPALILNGPTMVEGLLNQKLGGGKKPHEQTSSGVKT